MRLRRAVLACLLLGCGPKPIKATGEQAQGLTACGGALWLLGDWEKETAGELVAKSAVTNIERLEHSIRVTLDQGRSFVIDVAHELALPIAVGDVLDVSITCQPVGWNALDCWGAVVGAPGVIAFDAKSTATTDWTIERGPLVERTVHSNYGATSTYGVRFSYAGVTAVSPLRGCVELRTKNGTFRAQGNAIEHADPRPSEAADQFYFSVIRMPDVR